MHPELFLKTIYLGDRSCKNLLIDGWNRRVVLQVDLISRIRSDNGNWEFYSDEDIPDGFIVFTGADFIDFNPAGFIPNDLINSIALDNSMKVETIKEKFLFRLSIGSVNQKGESQEVIIRILADGIHLENPAQQGSRITE